MNPLPTAISLLLVALSLILGSLFLAACTPTSAERSVYTETTEDTEAATTCVHLVRDWTDRYSEALDSAEDDVPAPAELGNGTPETDIANRTVTHLRQLHRTQASDPARADAHRLAVEDLTVDGCHDAHPTY